MRFHPSSVGWGALAFVIGALPAFWLAGPALFADGAMPERLGSLAAYGALVLVLSVGGGGMAPQHRLAVSVGMAFPILPVLLLAEWGTPGMSTLAAGFVVAGAAAAWLGALAGARISAAVAVRHSK